MSEDRVAHWLQAMPHRLGLDQARHRRIELVRPGVVLLIVELHSHHTARERSEDALVSLPREVAVAGLARRNTHNRQKPTNHPKQESACVRFHQAVAISPIVVSEGDLAHYPYASACPDWHARPRVCGDR